MDKAKSGLQQFGPRDGAKWPLLADGFWAAIAKQQAFIRVTL
jgi:hypothetical protein